MNIKETARNSRANFLKVKNKINPNAVSLAGEFAVLSQLALHGYDASMTLGRTKGVDILISDPKKNRMYKLEVKTNLKNIRAEPAHSKMFGEIVSEWIMNAKHESIVDPDLFYCFVNIERGAGRFHFYIVPSKIVAKYVKKEHEFWHKKHRRRKNNATNMRLFRIGLKGCSYKIKTPTKEQCENNWNFTK